MRLLALDFGATRTGVAVTDESGTIARPLDPVIGASSSEGLSTIARMIADLQIGRVVVGLPVRLDGTEGPQAARSRSFASALRSQTQVPVELYDERFTTKLAATSTPHAKGAPDSVAACHLLNSYLERTQ